MDKSTGRKDLSESALKTGLNSQERAIKAPSMPSHAAHNHQLRKARIIGMGLSVLPFRGLTTFKHLALERGEERKKRDIDVTNKNMEREKSEPKPDQKTLRGKKGRRKQEVQPERTESAESYIQRFNRLALGSFDTASQAIERFVSDSKQNGSASPPEPFKPAKQVDSKATGSHPKAERLANKARQIRCFSVGLPKTIVQRFDDLKGVIDTYGQDADLHLRQRFQAGRERRSAALNHFLADYGLVSKQEIFEINKQLSIVSRELGALYKSTNKKAPVTLDRRVSERRIAPASMHYEERLIGRREADRVMQIT